MANEFFNKIFGKLFPVKESPHITHKKILKRSEQFNEAYTLWLESDEKRAVMQEIYTAYWKKREKRLDELDVHLLQMPYANGFALTYHKKMTLQVFQFILEWLKEKTKELGYMQVDATHRMVDKEMFVENIDKYYLKPPLSQNLEAPISQLYGNIAIELVYINNKPSYLKYVASVYSDRLYEKALDFDELIRRLLS